MSIYESVYGTHVGVVGTVVLPAVVDLFQFLLRSTYFLFHGNFYEQTDGVAMGSPLSPVIADFAMKVFELLALQYAPS